MISTFQVSTSVLVLAIILSSFTFSSIEAVNEILALPGANLILNCDIPVHPHKTVVWFYSKTANSERIMLPASSEGTFELLITFTSSSNTEETFLYFMIDGRVNAHFNRLEMKFVSKKSTGFYECIKNSKNPKERYFMFLNVITPRPEPKIMFASPVKKLSENQQTKLTCGSFGNHPAPTLSWIDERGKKIQGNITTQNHNYDVTSQILITMTPELNHTKISCVAHYPRLPTLVQLSKTAVLLELYSNEILANSSTVRSTTVSSTTGVATSTNLFSPTAPSTPETDSCCCCCCC